MIFINKLNILTELIIKKEIDANKLKSLLAVLKLWGLDVELKSSDLKSVKAKEEFTLSAGLWEDYQIDSLELRTKSWQRK